MLSTTLFNRELHNKHLKLAAYLAIIVFSIIPLFLKFPYRVNIFLTWEGAYRLYLGDIPYKDFGIPLGFAFWLIPALFFKLFGPLFTSLIKAQVFINLLSGFSFYSIISKFIENAGLRLLIVLIFILSFSFFNFWPWYNHTVIVFQLVSLAFLLEFALSNTRYPLLQLFLSALFAFLSFFTKQDGGGLCLLLNLALLIYFSIANKKMNGLLWFVLFYGLVAAAFIVPFIQHDFFYWFNLGQEPHNSRFSLYDLLSEVLGSSQWEKFYLFLIIILFYIKSHKDFIKYFYNQKEFAFFLLTLGILVEALIFQVTSYIPPDNNIFFHSFACCYILYYVGDLIKWRNFPILIASIGMVFLWWSGVYWKYVSGTVANIMSVDTKADYSVVSKKSWRMPEAKKDERQTANISKWVYLDVEAFKNVSMPKPTADGIERLLKSDFYKTNKGSLKVLNMSELTPLAVEMGYSYDSGQPLWFHRGVSIFQNEIDEICTKIGNKSYDLVLFEDIAVLNNFYAFEIRDCLMQHYELIDEFPAPRPRSGVIQVYQKP